MAGGQIPVQNAFRDKKGKQSLSSWMYVGRPWAQGQGSGQVFPKAGVLSRSKGVDGPAENGAARKWPSEAVFVLDPAFHGAGAAR